MRALLRWGGRLTVAALVLAVLALGGAWYLVSRSLPDYDTDVVLPGLAAKVRIVRDQNAVPHIRAASEADAFFALGVVHAQDRLWQMELSRRAATGRLSALLGPRTLALDRMVRTFDFAGLAEAGYARQTPAARAALDAYAAGVNAWIGHVNANALGRGAPEFFLFDGGIQPWRPADSLAILKMMALRLTDAARNEIQRARFLLALEPARVADILPDHPLPAVTVAPRHAEAARTPARTAGLRHAGTGAEASEPAARPVAADRADPARPRAAAGPTAPTDRGAARATAQAAAPRPPSETDAPGPGADGPGTVPDRTAPALADARPARPDALPPVFSAARDLLAGSVAAGFAPLLDPTPGLAGASNAWAVDGTRTATGAPLLANDPHLWLSAPSVWYLADMEGGELAAIGGTLPGVPAVLIGRNDDVAWGLTTVTADDQDIFIERLDPQNPERYRTPDGWARMERRTVRIEVAGEPPVDEVVLATRHGPVLGRNLWNVDAVTPPGHVAALSWTALQPDDRSYSAALRLMRARRIDDAIPVAAMVVAPAQTVTVADRRDIGMVVAGALPRRKADSRSQGRVPSPGWVAENDWDGLRPASETPRQMRPADGAVAHANNRVTDAPFPNHISFDWGDPYRIARLTRELSARQVHSLDGFVALQNDAVSQMARSVLPLVAADLWWRSDAAREGHPLRNQALDLLRNWSGNMDRHSPEPLIFAEWMRQLTLHIASDELAGLIGEMAGPRPIFVERVFRDIDGAAVWCDVAGTAQTETCRDMAVRALDAALDTLAAQNGETIEAWRWGAAHVAEHEHTPLSHVGPLGLIFSIRQETSGWDFTLLRGVSPGRGPRPFRNVHAAGLRMVTDFADLDRSVAVIATGQSGHPFSRFYDNLSDDWARGDTIPLSRRLEDAEAGSAGAMRLLPRP